MGPGRISKLFEARDGTLWIGLESGRLLAFKDGEARIHLPNSDPPGQAIIAMVQDPTDTIWLQTSSGKLGRLTADSVEFVATTGPLNHRSSLGLLADDKGVLWVGTKDGLKVWLDGQLNPPPNMTETPGQPLDAFASARDGAWWIFQDRRLNAPSPLGAALVKVAGAVPSHIVWSLLIDPGAKLITVTFTVLVSSVQETPRSVEVTERLNQVSCVSAPDV
jgi:streptogramin lyase